MELHVSAKAEKQILKFVQNALSDFKRRNDLKLFMRIIFHWYGVCGGGSLEKSEITKGMLIGLLYDYARIHKQPSARITFQGRRVNLCLGMRRKNYDGLTMREAYEMLKEQTMEKMASKGKGYIGRSMSVNAKRAYERGLKPLSRIRAADLRQNGFHYSVAFFRWLIHNWDIKPKEMHHTSAACRITAFYDGSVIRYAAHCCNLELLYQIYRGKLTVEQARQEREIRCAKVRILDTLLGGKSGRAVSTDCLFCDNLLFLSPKLCVRADNPGVEIMEVFDEQLESMENENLKNQAIELIKHKTTVYRKYLRK